MGMQTKLGRLVRGRFGLSRLKRTLNALHDDWLSGPIPRPPWQPPGNLRDRLAREFIRGTGLEIGALYNPLFVPRGVTVRYVDRCPVSELRAQLKDFPDLRDTPLVPVDILEDGATLCSIEPGSQDFIIANHFLEHVQEPIGTIRRHLELLAPGGILYLGVPDRRLTFDRERPLTTLDHLYRDHQEGPAWSFRDHLREWVALVEHKSGPQSEARLEELEAEGYPSIHYHVWEQDSLAAMLIDIRRRLELPFEIEAIVLNRPLVESICVLRKM